MIWRPYAYLLMSTLLLTESAGAVQFPSTTYRVGVLMLVRPDRPQLKGLRDGLMEAGYVENDNLRLEMPPVEGLDGLRVIGRGFVHSKNDVIVTTGTMETRIAQETTREVPVVFMPASDPVKAGFVKSLAQPGSNLTGISWERGTETYGKELEVFKELIPPLNRLTLLYDGRSKHPLFPDSLTSIRRVAAHMGIKLIEKPLASLSETELFISSLSRNETDGIFFVSSSLFNDFSKIALIAKEKKLPVYSAGNAEDGVLVSYAPNLYHLGRRASWYVDRILKGTKPRELPVELSTKFELVINLKVAKEVGLRLPPEVLLRATRLIK